jgi:ubiquinone/menaquinone biosynthesis C-methylase UbiE
MILSDSSAQLTTEKKKKMEAEYWKGKKDHNNISETVAQERNTRWEHNFLDTGINNKGIQKGKKIINIGGGHGKEAEYLLNNGASSVTIVDISLNQLTSAKMRCNQHNLKNLDMLLMDAENLGVKSKIFDIGLIFMALHHFPCHEKAILEVSRVSKHIIIIDIMNCGLTKFLNKFGLFLTEGPLIVNRVKDDEVKKIFRMQNMSYSIKYFFVASYFGNSKILINILYFIEIIINFSMSKFSPFQKFFGNIAIIESQ